MNNGGVAFVPEAKSKLFFSPAGSSGWLTPVPLLTCSAALDDVDETSRTAPRTLLPRPSLGCRGKLHRTSHEHRESRLLMFAVL
jgi:hypothetical protein